MLSGTKYFVCGLPYQFAIKEGLSSKEQLMDELREEDNDPITWTMEMECQFFGESEKAYFKTDSFDKIKSVSKPVYPKHFYNTLDEKKFKQVEKQKDEIRILSCDIATMGGKNNDNSIFSLICATPRYSTNDGTTRFKSYERQLRYMESYSGLNPAVQAIYIRRLFDDLDCDYIVLDRQGNGIGVYGSLCTKLYDEERDIQYDPIITMNEKDHLESFHLFDGCKEIIYTVSATEELNSNIAVEMHNCLSSHRLKILKEKDYGEEYFNGFKSFIKLRPETRAEFLAPYLQTQAFINETVLLEKVNHDKYVKLKEPSSGRKDRYTSVSYGNYFISTLEKEKIKKSGKFRKNLSEYSFF